MYTLLRIQVPFQIRLLIILIVAVTFMRPGGPTSYAASASIMLSPTSGPPTSSVTVSGQGFGSQEQIILTFDSSVVGNTTTNSSGAFTRKITIPATAAAGDHTVTATGQSSKLSAQARFIVQTNWTAFGFDAQHTHYNPYENTLNPSNVGKLQLDWSYPTAYQIASSPAVVNGIVITGSDDGDMYAVDALTGNLKWIRRQSNAFGLISPTVANGIVYVSTTTAALNALSVRTGQTIWSDFDVTSFSTPLVANGLVYVGLGDQKQGINAYNAYTGVLQWSANLPTSFPAEPAFSNGLIYDGAGNGNVYALNAATGKQQWVYNTPSGIAITSSPAIANGIVYIGSHDDRLYALDAATGVLKWSYTVGSAIESSPAVNNGIVYVGSDDNKLYALDAATGTLKWSYATKGMVISSPSIANGVVYVGSTDNNLYAFDALAGTLLWHFNTYGSITSSPAIVQGEVYVGSATDSIYAFSLPGESSPQITLTPSSGPPGTLVAVNGTGYGSKENVAISFAGNVLGHVLTDITGVFSTQITIPTSAPSGKQIVQATGLRTHVSAQAVFTVTT